MGVALRQFELDQVSSCVFPAAAVAFAKNHLRQVSTMSGRSAVQNFAAMLRLLLRVLAHFADVLFCRSDYRDRDRYSGDRRGDNRDGRDRPSASSRDYRRTESDYKSASHRNDDKRDRRSRSRSRDRDRRRSSRDRDARGELRTGDDRKDDGKRPRDTAVRDSEAPAKKPHVVASNDVEEGEEAPAAVVTSGDKASAAAAGGDDSSDYDSEAERQRQEAAEAKAKEDRRKRLQAIVEKHKVQGAPPGSVCPTPADAIVLPSSEIAELETIALPDDDVNAPSLSLMDLRNAKPLDTATATQAATEQAPAAAAKADTDGFDMFSDDALLDAAKRGGRRAIAALAGGDALARAVGGDDGHAPELVDNWTDAEGYFKVCSMIRLPVDVLMLRRYSVDALSMIGPPCR